MERWYEKGLGDKQKQLKGQWQHEPRYLSASKMFQYFRTSL